MLQSSFAHRRADIRHNCVLKYVILYCIIVSPPTYQHSLYCVVLWLYEFTQYYLIGVLLKVIKN